MEFVTYQPTSKIKRMFLQNEETNHIQNIKKSKNSNINKGASMIYQNYIKSQEVNMKFYVNISEDIFNDQRLPSGAKLLYGKIKSLSHQLGFCWATNKYLAKIMGVCDRTIRNWNKKLKDYHYIESEIIYNGDSKEVVARKLLVSNVSVDTENTFRGDTENKCHQLIKEDTNKNYKLKEKKRTYARARMCAHTCDKDENEKNVKSKIETEKDLTVNNNVENSNKVESLKSKENQEVINKPKYVKDLQLNEENTEKYSEGSKNIPNSSLNHSENKAPRKTYNQIIEEYTPNKELQDRLKQFLPVKFMKCKRLTNDALYLLLSDLDKYASTIKEKLAIVTKSIKRCYSEFFPLSESEKDLYLSEPKKTSYDLEEYAKLCLSVFDN